MSTADEGRGIAVDPHGSAYVTGVTNSADFPTVAGVVQPRTRGFSDAFVTKLSASGSTLAYSTYLGGSRFDDGEGIAVGPHGSAYVSGFTLSADFPTSPGAFQRTYAGGENAFVARLVASGSALVDSTYLGGSDVDEGQGIAVDPHGSAYVTGLTTSTDFPTSAGAFQPTFGGGDADVFVAKLSFTPSGSRGG